MKNSFVVITAAEYARLIDLKTRMGILIDEASRQENPEGYYVFDERLIRLVTGIRQREEE